eukprot:COSAG02_NODE_7_length_64539_cov_120.393482_12_plen_89_part_00
MQRLSPPLEEVVPRTPKFCGIDLRMISVLLRGAQSAVEQIATYRNHIATILSVSQSIRLQGETSAEMMERPKKCCELVAIGGDPACDA